MPSQRNYNAIPSYHFIFITLIFLVLFLLVDVYKIRWIRTFRRKLAFQNLPQNHNACNRYDILCLWRLVFTCFLIFTDLEKANRQTGIIFWWTFWFHKMAKSALKHALHWWLWDNFKWEYQKHVHVLWKFQFDLSLQITNYLAFSSNKENTALFNNLFKSLSVIRIDVNMKDLLRHNIVFCLLSKAFLAKILGGVLCC